jgi:hypothetical protein
MLYNPLKEKIHRNIRLPVYYTGLSNMASIREKEGPVRKYTINRDYEVQLNVTLDPESYTWYTIE